VAVLGVALAAACLDEGRRTLEHELSDRYGEAYVGGPDSISANLPVLFPASPFAERPDSARRATARKVAERFARSPSSS
jgi:hypothetical protein